MTKKIIIGSRGSKLALLYAQKAKEQIIKKTTVDTKDSEIKSISTKVFPVDRKFFHLIFLNNIIFHLLQYINPL